MSKSRAQQNRSLRFGRQAIGLGVVLALLSIQQTWAAALCLCDGESGMQPRMTCCGHHELAPGSDHPAGMDHQAPGEMYQPGDRNGSSRAGYFPAESESTTDAAGNPARPSTVSCCELQPQAELPILSLSFQAQPLEVATSQPVFAPRTTQWLPIADAPKPPKSRPVYLTVSAFLI